MTAIPEPAPQDARDRQRRGALLIDVREPHEHATGMAEGALALPMGALLADPGTHLPHRDAAILLICQSGRRSMIAATALAEQGYADVASVAGGTARWIAEGLPTVAGFNQYRISHDDSTSKGPLAS